MKHSCYPLLWWQSGLERDPRRLMAYQQFSNYDTEEGAIFLDLNSQFNPRRGSIECQAIYTLF